MTFYARVLNRKSLLFRPDHRKLSRSGQRNARRLLSEQPGFEQRPAADPQRVGVRRSLQLHRPGAVVDVRLLLEPADRRLLPDHLHAAADQHEVHHLLHQVQLIG